MSRNVSRGLIRGAAQANKAAANFIPREILARIMMFALAKMQYPRDAGSSARVMLVILEDIPIIYQHHSDFETEKEKKNNTTFKEQTSSLINIMSLKTLCTQHNVAVVSDPL